MRKLLLAVSLLAMIVPSRAVVAFEPASDGLVIVNLSVPARVETQARLGLLNASIHSAELVIEGEMAFSELDAASLSGRSPRWLRFVVGPGIVDSLVLDWRDFEVEVDGAWTRPEVRDPTVIGLHQRIDKGTVLVVNLRWRPGGMSPDVSGWHPVIETEELAEPPAGGRIYVSEADEGIVSVYERIHGRMVRALALGGAPRDLDFDPVQQRLFVSLGARDELAVVDVAGRESIRRLPLSFGADPTRVLLTQDRQRVAVLAPERDLVFLFSASSLQEVARVRVGQEPVALTEEHGGGRIYVSCRKAGEVHVLDPADGRTVARFDGFESPTEIVALRSGEIALGQDRISRVDLIDPNTGGVQSSIGICGTTAGLLDVERLERLYVLDSICSEFTIYQPATALEIGAIPLEERAGLPSLGPRGADLLVPLPESRRVLVLSVERGDPRLVLETGSGPWRALAP